MKKNPESIIRQCREQLKSLPYPFTTFMDELANRGFVITVDHYFRVLAVIDRFGKGIAPGNLKYLLCPVFATHEKQQNLFYRLFDKYFPEKFPETKDVEPEPEPEPPETKPEPLGYGKWHYILAGLLWMAFIVLVAFQWSPKPEIKKPETVVQQVPVPDVDRLPDITLDIPLETGPMPELSFWARNGRFLRPVLVAIPILIGLLFVLYRAGRRRAAVVRSKGKPPPWMLPIRVPEQRPEYLAGRLFFETANRLRARVASGMQRFDPENTIRRTIKKGGFPDVCYQAVTRPSEYLVLIDLARPEDHMAHFTRTAVRAFADEGAFVDILYFREDPRICFTEPGTPGIRLADLPGRYPGRNLIIAGECDALLDPTTGRLDAWTEAFHAWKHRAVLTPTRPRHWGMREIALAGEFLVLPATLGGIRAVADHFQAETRPDLRQWAKDDQQKSAAPERPAADIRALEKTLDPETFQWLCACAVYPELNFSLTLHLGTQMDVPLTEDRLLRLIRLPWFRKGALPDTLRAELRDRLGPEELMEVKTRIYELLKSRDKDMTPEERDAYQLNLAVHRYEIGKDLRRNLKRIRENEDRVVRDHTLLALVEGANTPLGLVIPKALHKVFFRRGCSLFGLKPWVPLFFSIIPALCLYLWVPRPPERVTAPVKSHVILEFAHIPAGSFLMGSPEDEPGRDSDESPQHRVTLTQGFYLQKTEVTQAQWMAVMGNNPSRFNKCGGDCPVERVSWNDAQEFITRLNRAYGADVFRLPSEAEWEYACRAGTTTPFNTGKCLSSDTEANYDGGYPQKDCKEGQYRDKTTKAKTFPPNAWGLFDMHGNVWEWVEDDWHDDYNGAPVDGSPWVDSPRGANRVVRGGAWNDLARGCRSAFRVWYGPGRRNGSQGFRLAASQVNLEKQQAGN